MKSASKVAGKSPKSKIASPTGGSRAIASGLDVLIDARTNCLSVLVRMTTRDYIQMVTPAHSQRGLISGQRDVLQTTTAKRIRDRMVSDIRNGAVLPPLVIGFVVTQKLFDKLTVECPADPSALLLALEGADLSIIDGMQRTASLKSAIDAEPAVLDRELRIELWIASSVRALVYRMLVLNTGQVPWTLSRQLAVVYAPLLKEIIREVGLNQVSTPDDPIKRVAPGQYNAESIVELYLAFSLRKSSVDTKERLSDEFSRLDFLENLSSEPFQKHFYQAFRALVDLDIAFGRVDVGASKRTTGFGRGRDIFGSQPARVGFIVAVAQHVIGRPGLERPEPERATRINQVASDCKALVAKLQKLNETRLSSFLKLDVLNEVVDKKVGQVGRYERGVFNEAFKVLIDERFEVPSLEPCWRAS